MHFINDKVIIMMDDENDFTLFSNPKIKENDGFYSGNGK